jgi:histidinol-phosphate aminotransferase
LIRAGVDQLPRYEAGRPIEEVARELGFDPREVVKLASNESPLPPFPEVQEAIAQAVSGINRYPDNNWGELAGAVAGWLGVETDQLMFGGGSSELLRVFALAVGGPGTTAVYPWPSFVIYRMAPIVAGSTPVEVPLTIERRLDVEALVEAVTATTTLLYVCNPNNPTGSYLGGDEIKFVVDRVPETVLVVIDEAYFEFVTAPDFITAIPEALSRPNVVVTRTFSKIFGLASLRVGYAVGQPATLVDLRRAQAPFTVGSLGQVAATVAVRYGGRVAERRLANQVERDRLETAFGELGIEFVPSQANFVYLRPRPGHATFDEFLSHAVIVRSLGGDWIRVTVGSVADNDRFLQALDRLR